jgi:hypothetical protein
MFDLPTAEEVINQGGNKTIVVLASNSESGGWRRWSEEIDVGNMYKVLEYEFDRSPPNGTTFEEPW